MEHSIGTSLVQFCDFYFLNAEIITGSLDANIFSCQSFYLAFGGEFRFVEGQLVNMIQDKTTFVGRIQAHNILGNVVVFGYPYGNNPFTIHLS